MQRDRTGKSSFRSLFRDLFGTSPDRRRELSGRRLILEPLEKRQLLAVLTVTATDPDAAEAGNDPGSFSISLSDTDPDVSYTVYFNLTGDFDDVTTSGDEFEGVSGTLKKIDFSGDGTAELTFTPINDARSEGDRSITLTLTEMECCNCCCMWIESPGDPSSASITIVDDDQWIISAEADDQNDDAVEGDSEDSVGFAITRSADPAITSGSATDTRYAIAVDFVLGGDAVRGTDYVVMSGESVITSNTISILEDETAVALSIVPINDAVKEADMPVTLTITSASSSGVEDPAGCCCTNWGPGGAFPIDENADTGTVTILDDDHWDIQIERTSTSEGIVERTGEAEFQVSRVDDGTGRSGDTSYGILVDLAMSGSADQYSDYNLVDDGGYLAIYGDKTVIEEGETSVVFQLVTVNDHIKEGDQTAVLTVEEGTSINMAGGLFGADAANGEASVMILDDDHWVVSLTESGQPGDPRTLIEEEGTTSTGIVLTRTHEVMTPTRPGDTTYPIDATLAYDGEATAADYQMIETVVQSGGGTEEVTRDGGTTTFEIQEGQTQKSIEIKAVDDQYIELLHELLEITLTDAEYSVQTYPLGTSQLVELQIEDNDEPILVLVSYEDANSYRTDPVYVGQEFQFIWKKNSEITGNQWQDRTLNGLIDVPGEYGDQCYPVTYERTDTEASRFQVIAKWVGYVEEGYSMTVKATGPDCMEVPESNVTADAGWIVTGVVQSTGDPFPDVVTYYSSFTLTWTFQIDDEAPAEGEAARSAGQCSNEMYVTYDVPDPNKLIYHSSLHLGTVAAAGDLQLACVVNDVWSAFVGRSVQRRDGTTMTYYGNPRSTNDSAVLLLRDADGNCSSWQHLLQTVFFAQGLNAEAKKLRADDLDEGIMVNNYSGFNQDGSITEGAVLAVSSLGNNNLSDYSHLAITSSGEITTGDVADVSGIPGQSNTDPTSIFRFHAIVRIGYDLDNDGEIDYRYLDPSYGVEYADWMWQGGYYYTEAEQDAFAIADFVSTALAAIYYMGGTSYFLPSTGLPTATINETITGDLDGDGNLDTKSFNNVLLMRIGDESDIVLI